MDIALVVIEFVEDGLDPLGVWTAVLLVLEEFRHGGVTVTGKRVSYASPI